MGIKPISYFVANLAAMLVAQCEHTLKISVKPLDDFLVSIYILL